MLVLNLDNNYHYILKAISWYLYPKLVVSIQCAGVGATVKGIGLKNLSIMAAGTKVGILSPEYSITPKIESPFYLKMKGASSKAISLLKKITKHCKMSFFPIKC